MNFQRFATSRFGTRLWMGLGRWLSPRAGNAVAHVVSGHLGRRKHTELFQAVRSNQAVVRGLAASDGELDRAARAVLRHGGKTSYDLVRMVALGDDALRSAVTFGPEAMSHLEAARADGRGVMVCGPHLSAFNLMFLAFALCETPIQILLAQAGGGYELVEKLLNRREIEATQVGPATLHSALRRLRAGGIVVTGIDWPEAPGDTEMMPFFGVPARLPTGHIRMAMSTHARLLPVACRWDPGTGYRLLTAAPMELELSGDRVADVRHNAQRVLAVAEQWIRERSEQWLMYYRVWNC